MGPAAGTERSEPRRTARECIMKPAMLLLAFQLLAGPVALSARAQTDPVQTAESAFAEGKALVETNCADCTGATAEGLKKGLRDIERALELGVQHAPPEPLVKGRHLLALGLTPGPRVGAVLKEIYERQLDGSIATVEEGIALAKEILAQRS